MTELAERLDQAIPVIAASAPQTDSQGSFPRPSVQALAESGLLGITLPTEVGGLGGGPREMVDAVTAVARACGSTSMIYLMHISAVNVLAAAPPAAANGLLGEMASGAKLGTLAFSEKGSRSHFWAPVSRAEQQGDNVHIAADKSWVTSASEADVYVASALAPESTGFNESNLYLVERETPGVEVKGPFVGLGLRGNDSAPVRLDVELSASARLGDEKAGFGLMMSVVLPWFSLGNSAVSLGLAQASLEAAIAHASGSRFEHLDSTLADLPTIRAYLAKAWGDLSAHQALLRETADRVANPDEGTTLAVLVTKAACNEAALRITESAMRVAGGAGFSNQVPVDRPYRDARAGFVMAPTSDALYDFTGRALCGLDLF